MKTSVCLAVVVAVVVIQMVNAQETTRPPRITCPKCDFVCLSGDGEFKESSSIRCPPCKCPNTCRNFNCSKNEKCVLEQVVCVRSPCFPVPKCIRINGTTTNTTTVAPPICRDLHEVRCMAGCERVLGPDGCPFCKCQTTCAAVTCLVGFECKMVVVTCFRAPCPESHAICVPIRTTVATTPCPVYKCADGCVPTTGPNGCRTCDCPPTCKDINCTKDEECFLEQIRQCFAPPCFPTPICVPRNVSCTGTPNTRRCIDDPPYRWSYNASTHSCQSFRYYGCTPSPNTFTSRTVCEDKCKSSNVCGHCRDDCYEFKKKGQPPKCICPDPCKNVTCTDDGEVCRLVEPVCDKEPCNAPPEPFCVKNPCPRPLPCGKKCEYGLQTNDNGCPLCECCEQPTQT